MAVLWAALLTLPLTLQADGAATRRWALPDLDFEASAAVVASELGFSAIGDPGSPVGAPWTPASEEPIRGASLVDFELESGGTWLVTASGVERLFLDGGPVPIVDGEAIPFPVLLSPGVHRAILLSAGEPRWNVARPRASVVAARGRADVDPSSSQTWYWGQVEVLLVNTTREPVHASVSYGPLVSSSTPGPWDREAERAGWAQIAPFLPARVSARGKIAEDNAPPAPGSAPMLPLRISVFEGAGTADVDVDVAVGPLAELELLGSARSRVWLVEADPSSGARGLARHDAFLLAAGGREAEVMSEEAFRSRRTRPDVAVFYGEPEGGEAQSSPSGFAVQALFEDGLPSYVLSAASDSQWTLGVGWMAGRD